MTDEPNARQLEILELRSRGLTAAEVGKRLYLTEATIRTHMKTLFRLLGAKNIAHALRIANSEGFIDLSAPVERVPEHHKRTSVAQDANHEKQRVQVDPSIYERFPSLSWGAQEFADAMNGDHVGDIADGIAKVTKRQRKKGEK